MYQDSDKDKIVKHILCTDTHISSKCERNAFIYVKHFLLIRTRLMHRDTFCTTLLINHNMRRKTDEPKIWTLNITVLIHKRFLHYGFLKGGKRLTFKYVALIFWLTCMSFSITVLLQINQHFKILQIYSQAPRDLIVLVICWNKCKTRWMWPSISDFPLWPIENYYL